MKNTGKIRSFSCQGLNTFVITLNVAVSKQYTAIIPLHYQILSYSTLSSMCLATVVHFVLALEK